MFLNKYVKIAFFLPKLVKAYFLNSITWRDLAVRKKETSVLCEQLRSGLYSSDKWNTYISILSFVKSIYRKTKLFSELLK